MSKYTYCNPMKLEEAQIRITSKLLSIGKAIEKKEEELESAEEKASKRLKSEISLLKSQVKDKDEMILGEYLNLCGRVEDENGKKILTPCDLAVGEKKIANKEIWRKEKLAEIKKDKK